ncbi:MAG: plasmid pRiA4b ORF-3 family protein [Verrucomicrobiota bacterium]
MKSSSKSASSARRASSPGVAPAFPTYQLKITLELVKPAIWRRISVPGNASLGWLHAVIQLAMGWTNSHLHQFEVGGRLFSDPAVNSPGFEGEPEVLDEAKFSLRDVAPNEKHVLHYEYDFGDGWQHTIAVERILPPEPGAATVARCLAGKRACPPDDCGGPWGYQDLLKILRNPRHEEHNSMKDWLGRPFDPEAFDPVATNAHLQMLKWPRTSEAQLRRLLMNRDGFRE